LPLPFTAEAVEEVEEVDAQGGGNGGVENNLPNSACHRNLPALVRII
jgi:hypothetical protein